jgi:hypothetical protein
VHRYLNRRTTGTAAIALALVGAGIAGASSAVAGVTGPAFYVDGSAYRTVGTPNDLSGTGGPAHSFDSIYDFGGIQMNVATAKPGDRDYNGGRWKVHALSFPAGYAAALAAGDTDGDGVIDSDGELYVAVAAGTAVDTGVVRSFTCPVIKLPSKG